MLVTKREETSSPEAFSGSDVADWSAVKHDWPQNVHRRSLPGTPGAQAFTPWINPSPVSNDNHSTGNYGGVSRYSSQSLGLSTHQEVPPPLWVTRSPESLQAFNPLHQPRQPIRNSVNDSNWSYGYSNDWTQLAKPSTASYPPTWYTSSSPAELRQDSKLSQRHNHDQVLPVTKTTWDDFSTRSFPFAEQVPSWEFPTSGAQPVTKLNQEREFIRRSYTDETASVETDLVQPRAGSVSIKFEDCYSQLDLHRYESLRNSEDRLLIHLRHTSQYTWKEIVAIFQLKFRRKYTVAMLQMRYYRMQKRHTID